MRALRNALGVAAGISVLAACTSGQSGIEPPSKGVDVQNTTVLQFRVGTARHATGAIYLNTLTTYRQPNGLSATLYNTPTITGPAGFVVPAAQTTSTTLGSQPNTDAGTNHISATPPTQPGTTAVLTTFNQTGGIFAYGIAPANSTTSGAANYANFNINAAANSALYADDISTIVVGTPAAAKGNTVNNITGGGIGGYTNLYTQPLYLTPSRRLPFLLGPPAVPDFHNGTFPSGFRGYDSGFTYFAVTPVAGQYNLTMTVPSANIGQNAASFSVNATLSTLTGLPVVATPTITPSGVSGAACGGGGGGGATFVVAPGPVGVTNQVLYVADVNINTGQPTHYSFNVGAAGGTFTLGATAGPNGGAPFCVGDSVFAWVVGADYDIVGLAPPTNTQQSPALPSPQADISVSLVREIAY